MPITPDFDLGLVDSFDGATTDPRQRLSARPNWVVRAADDSGAGAADAWQIANGQLRVFQDYEVPTVGIFGPAQGGTNRFRWVLRPPVTGPGSNWYERVAAAVWINGAGNLRFYFRPRENRLIWEGGGLNNFVSLAEFGPSNTPFFTRVGGGSNDNWLPPTETITLEGEVNATTGRALIYLNGKLITTLDPGYNPISYIDVSAYSGTKSGSVGLQAGTSESFSTGKPIADDFSIPGLGGSQPILARAIARNPAGLRRITRTFTATGGVPARGIHRILNADTQAVVRDWDYGIADSVNGQEVTQSVDLPKGRMTIEWGFTTAAGKAGKTPATTVAVCRYVQGIGQSNMTFRRALLTTSSRPALAFVLNFGNPNEWSIRGPDDTGQLNTAAILAARLAEITGDPVLVVLSGQAASSVDGLLPGANGWDGGAPEDMGVLTQQARAGGFPAEGYIYDQGEEDARVASTAAAWQSKVSGGMLPAIRNLAGDQNVPILINMLGRYNSNVPPPGAADVAAAGANYRVMRAASRALVDPTRKVAIGSTPIGVPMSDEYHFTAAGFETRARREAQSLARLWGFDTYDGAGPLPGAGTRSGTTVTIPVDLNGADSISGTALTGYEVSADDGTTWTAVPSANATVTGSTIVLSGVAAGTNRWRSFAAMNYDDSSLAVGNYSAAKRGTHGPATIPVFPASQGHAVTSSGGTPTPTPPSTPTPTPPATPTPTPTPGATPRGTVTALPDWMARFMPTPDASPRPGGAPNGSVSIRAKMDPHTRRNIGFDFSALLGPDGEIANITKVLVGATAGLDGFRVATDPAVFLSVDGRQGQLRAYILPARQDDGIFNSTGTVVPITIKGEQTDGQDVEATLLVTVVNL